MTWNWEQADWPKFTYDSKALAALERQFLVEAGEFSGAFKHISKADQDQLKIELLGDEALKTSEIEGEILDRESVQSSLCKQLGIKDDKKKSVPPAERGVTEMMVDLYNNFQPPLKHETMFAWHKMLMANDKSISVIGGYRTHKDAMQVVSSRMDKRVVYFEAPPSTRMKAEMAAFVKWFNSTAPNQKDALPALTRSAIAHLYFVSIHPFEDGNGRIARALSEKSLAQNLGHATLIILAYTIQRKRKAYYDALARANKNNEITEWLVYFANTIIEAQKNTTKRIEFYIAKAKFKEKFRGALNDRQEKALERMFNEGIDGFRGGLSAENYITITKASRATATRDLTDLVEKGALKKTGELRHTRYYLALPGEKKS